MEEPVRLEALDTSYVNVSRLIRHLRQQGFAGRLHVTLEEYEADVFLYPNTSPSVWEIDRASGKGTQGDGALERLLVRAQEPGGTVTIFQRSPEAVHPAPVAGAEPKVSIDSESDGESTETETDWSNLLAASSELIAAVERAVETTGEDFSELFAMARVAVGDDYPFLDPTLGGFDYKSSGVQLQHKPAAKTYVAGLSECLRRVNDRLGDSIGVRYRERVAAELAIAMRRRPDALAQFTAHLDRIAGTKVL